VTELSRLLEAAVSWAVRGIIVGGIGGGQTERYYSNAAAAVRSRRATTTEDVARELGPILPEDDFFQATFSQRRVNSTKLAKYYLLALQQAAAGTFAKPAIIADTRLAEVSLLHVMPRRPLTDNWNFASNVAGQWALRLGNQVLVEESLDAARVLDFRERRLQLKMSDQYWAKLAARQSEWSEDAVTEMQKQMAALAPVVWPDFFPN